MQSALLRSNNGLAAGTLALQSAQTAFAFFLSQTGSLPLWFAGQVLLGICFWKWFVILHDCGHGSFFSSRILNSLTGCAASVFCTLPFYPWREIHRKHHQWTGWKDIDPTMEGTLKRRGNPWDPLIDFCWKHWIPILSPAYIFGVFWNLGKADSAAAGRPWGKLKNRLSVLALIATYGVLWVVLGAHLLKLVALAYVVFLSISDLSLLTQHVHLPQRLAKGDSVRPFTPSQQDEFSWTLEIPAAFERHVFGCFNRHGPHHVLPQVPHYRLDQIKYPAAHSCGWRTWLTTAKRMRGTELLYGEGFGRP